MSLRANPTVIGLFLIGAAAVSIAGTAGLATNTWFQKRSTFISFFQESVNGLEHGAPVKFQGVPIGAVTGILIQIDQRDKAFQVPVQFEIDVERLTTQLGTFVDLSNPEVLREQIRDGLRAQLQSVSIVTGQLYVELNYRSDAAPPQLEPRATAWPEIPTTPSLMSTLGTGAGSLVGDMMKVLFQVNEMLADVNMPEINKAVVASAQAVERLVSAPEIRATLQQAPAMTAQINQTMAEVQRLAVQAGAAIGPMHAEVTAASTEAIATMKALRRTLEETHGLLSVDTGPGFALQGALTSLRGVADALRLLITSLEQNPDMMLRGKKPAGK